MTAEPPVDPPAGDPASGPPADAGATGPTPDWGEVRELFERCVELAAPARAAALANAAPALRAEVEALLREITDQPDRLDPDSSHRALVASAERVLARGRKIGGYHVLELLGQGGMSTVYLAEQEQPRRRVALKLLTATLSDTGESLQRFRNECELLARLQHPGIAQIHAAGVHEEATAMGNLRWPFFVMEYVEDARVVGDWVRSQELDDREIIALFVTICAAVQHAHERGVVHRDLKPHNVLVDGDGNVKVIDFGIARSISDSVPEQLTRTGDVLGTLHYMSPEQIRGDEILDTRSDVHALGVMLFEQLAGRLPFDLAGRGLPEVGRILAEREATPLRTVRPDLDVDLEVVLQKALSKDPQQRYGSAGSLGEDLQRHLDHQPITARPPSLRYQLRMFARRRRGLVASALAIVLISTIGGASSVVYAFRAHDAERLAVEESAAKEDALQRTFDMAIHTVLDLPRRLRDVPHATELRGTLIAEAATQLEFLEHELTIDDDRRRQLARAYLELGGIQRNNGRDKDAIARTDHSYAQCERHIDVLLAAAPDDPRVLHLRKELAFQRGTTAYNRTRDMPTAERYWDIAATTVDRLAELPPVEGLDLRLDRARVKNCRASVAIMVADTEAEVAHLKDGCAILTEIRSDHPDDLDTAMALGNLCYRLGQAYSRLPDHERELQSHATALQVLELADRHPDDIVARHLRAKIRGVYGFALCRGHDLEKGERLLRTSRDELIFLRDRDPQNALVQSTFAFVSSQLAEHLVALGGEVEDAELARRHFQEAHDVATAGFETAEALLERSRTLQNRFVSKTCSDLADIAAAGLRGEAIDFPRNARGLKLPGKDGAHGTGHGKKRGR